MQYKLTISSEYSAIEFASNLNLGAGQWSQLKASQFKPSGDRYVLVLRFTEGQIVVRAIDATTSQPVLERIATSSAPIILPDSNQPIRFAIGNASERAVAVAVAGFRVGLRVAQNQAATRQTVELPLKLIDDGFLLPKFSVAVRPCGSVDAYSQADTGAIVVCTEILADILQQDLGDAFPAILFHEVAHTILNLWGLPGYDNEDVADEFSAILNSKASIEAYAQWLERRDSVSEAAVQLLHGDRHPLSIQRARNVRAAKANPQLAARWARLLAPYAKGSPSPRGHSEASTSNDGLTASHAEGNLRDATVERNVQLREGPSATTQSLGLLSPGTKLQLTEADPTAGFYHVRTDTGTLGWVWTRNVVVVRQAGPPEPSKQPTSLNETASGVVAVGCLVAFGFLLRRVSKNSEGKVSTATQARTDERRL